MTTRFKQLTLSIAVLVMGMFSGCKTASKNSDSGAVDYDFLIQSVMWMQESEEAEEIFRQAYYEGVERLKSNLNEMSSGLPAAIVVDIDETVLDNNRYLSRLIVKQKPHSPEGWEKWVGTAQCGMKPGAMEFFQEIQDLEVEVFYISERSVNLLGATMENLSMYELPNVDTDHVLLSSDPADRNERMELIRMNRTIVLFVGDQLTNFANDLEEFEEVPDLQAELRARFLLVPNPTGIDLASPESFHTLRPGVSTRQFKDQLHLE